MTSPFTVTPACLEYFALAASVGKATTAAQVNSFESSLKDLGQRLTLHEKRIIVRLSKENNVYRRQRNALHRKWEQFRIDRIPISFKNI